MLFESILTLLNQFLEGSNKFPESLAFVMVLLDDLCKRRLVLLNQQLLDYFEEGLEFLNLELLDLYQHFL